MKEFDRELLATKEWEGWERKRSQLYCDIGGGLHIAASLSWFSRRHPEVRI